jgi:hypothetical protein
VPAVACRAGLGDRGPPGLVLVDAAAGQAEQGRDEGDRPRGGGDDAEDRGKSEQADVGDARGVQAEQGDRDRAPGASTARPLVVVQNPAASAGSAPLIICCRNRVVRKTA